MAVLLRQPCPREMVYLLFDMLRIFVLADQREYQRNVTLYLLCLVLGSGTNSSFWNFFKHSQPALNEDLCERELSSLACAVSNDTTGACLKFCDKQFKLGSFVRNILDKWEKDRFTDNKDIKWTGRVFITAEDGDVQLVSQFFRGRIRQLSAPALFLSYTGDFKKWTNRATGSQSQKHVLRKELLVKTSDHLYKVLDDCQRLIRKPWEVDMKEWIPDIKNRPVDEAPAPAPVIPDIEDLLAFAQEPVVDDPEDILADEFSEGEDAGPLPGDQKRCYIPPGGSAKGGC